MAENVDVIICGSGSAGLCAGAWLAQYGVSYRILERRDGPLKMGQADGVQCRTVEIYESFGISEELLREAHHVLETVFWSPSPSESGGIHRSGRTIDTPVGLSHMPHVLLNQARMNDLLIRTMRRFNGRDVDYGYDVESVEVDEEAAWDSRAHPVTVRARKDGQLHTFKAKYAVACDGAHSNVRRSLGITMIGDSSDSLWGVMDVIPRTEFPDIRKKTSVRSNLGNLMIIPREGGSLVRMYIELPTGTNAKDVTLEEIQTTAKHIFKPYDMEFVETVWWSAYSVGQRYADTFHKSYRLFLAGDACHTHSPKAGQGMNVSLQDGYNIGWKLGAVLTGQANPSLLETYVLERQKVAVDLIEFDRYFSKLFASSRSQSDVDSSHQEFQEGFIKSAKFTAGLTSRYAESMITSAFAGNGLATNITLGMRLPSSQVVRFCDSQPMQLARALPSDRRWRILVFAGDISAKEVKIRLSKLANYLNSSEGPVHRFTPESGYIDSIIEPVLIGHGDRYSVDMPDIPDYFRPLTGRYLHKVYYDDESHNKGHGHVYEHLGIDPGKGCIVIVRPDQHVSAVLALEEYSKCGEFFEGFLYPRR